MTIGIREFGLIFLSLLSFSKLSGADREFGVIEGRVLDLQGNNVDGAKVTVQAEVGGRSPNIAEASSDGSGHFILAGLEPGLLSVRVVKRGLPSSEQQVLVRGRDRLVLSFCLTWGIYTDARFYIDGQVVDKTGEPVTGAKVAAAYYHLLNPKDQLSIVPAVTGQEGRFRLVFQEVGQQIITVSHPGFRISQIVTSLGVGSPDRRDAPIRIVLLRQEK